MRINQGQKELKEIRLLSPKVSHSLKSHIDKAI